jgi:predicted SnoaL-like aldol condensation-catalyzing enzyme
MPPADTDLTQRNRETVQRFCEIIFNEHKTAAAVDFIQDDYSQHSPFLADGRQPFIDYFSDLFAEYPRARLHVKRIIAEGDYVGCAQSFCARPRRPGHGHCGYLPSCQQPPG